MKLQKSIFNYFAFIPCICNFKTTVLLCSVVCNGIPVSLAIPFSLILNNIKSVNQKLSFPGVMLNKIENIAI